MGIVEELVNIWPNEVCDKKLAGRSLNSICMESPTVQRLPIHLPNEHYVNFHAHQTVNEVLARQNVEKTQLTAWFDYNSAHDDGLGFTYWQFPQHYTWNAKDKSWHPRRRARVIGRMYFVSPSKGEQFFLRLLLTIFEGRKS